MHLHRRDGFAIRGRELLPCTTRHARASVTADHIMVWVAPSLVEHTRNSSKPEIAATRAPTTAVPSKGRAVAAFVSA